MVAPVARSFDLAALVRCVEAEERGVRLGDAVLRSGAENVVVETADLIVRFPRDETTNVEWEAAVVRLVQGRTRLATPEPLWLGARTRCMAYRRITGTSFDRRAYVASDEPMRDAFAHSLAEALVEVQDALAAAVVEGAVLPVVDLTEFYGPLRRRLPELPADARPPVRDLLDEFEDTFLRGPGPLPVAVHNDFHFANLVLDAPLGRVSGLWDFSCAAIGDATWDLRYFEGDLASPWEEPVHAPGGHLDLLTRVVRSYSELRGVPVDPRACVVANRVEALYDLGTAGIPEAVRSWAAWDAVTGS